MFIVGGMVRHPRTRGCADARGAQGRTTLGPLPRRERERESRAILAQGISLKWPVSSFSSL